MKKIIVTAIALAAATPALANDQLARSLGVEPGQFTTAELAILKSRSTFEGNDGRANLSSARIFSSQGVHNPVAAEQFARSFRESNEGGFVD